MEVVFECMSVSWDSFLTQATIMEYNDNLAYNHCSGSKNTVQEPLYDSPYMPSKLENHATIDVKNQGSASTKTINNKTVCACLGCFTLINLVIAIVALILSLIQYNSTNSVMEALNFQLNFSSEAIQALRNRLNNSEQELSEMRKFYEIRSCKDIPQDSASGLYTIHTSKGNPVVYCDINPRSCETCNATDPRGWTRVANIDMTDNRQQCPDEFKMINRTTPPLRICGRPADGHSKCVSTTFPVHGIEYSRVCGRVIGYQIGSPNGFLGYNVRNQTTIDGYFLSGISLTYGQSPRQHIWAFVNAQTEGTRYNKVADLCPCTNTRVDYTASVPPFIGEDYFCDTGINGAWTDGTLYTDDPLWDGQGCGETSTCCEFNNPPWFCKQLPQPTTQDIELRLCENSSPNDDDSPFEIVDLYIN